MGKKMRVDKLLSNVGVASRAELKKYCKQGLISVNGKVINNPGVQVDPENDEVKFNGEKIVYREFVYLNSKEINAVDKIIMIGPKNSFYSWKDEFINNFGEKKGLKVLDIQD